MPRPMDTIEQEAMKLTESQKITLAHRLLVQTEPAADPKVDAAWEDEIEYRIQKLDSSKTGRHSVTDVMDELDRREQR